MYEPHPHLIPPSDDARIWRFMDIGKFLWLLSSSSLYFRRLDLFRDPYEGVVPQLSAIEYERNLPGQGKQITSFIESQRKQVFVNSWHINEFESAAMWDLYLKSADGIAIETSFAKLRDSFSAETTHSILIGKVNYIDYAAEMMPFGNILFAPMHKRKSFEHERELRALVWLLATLGRQGKNPSSDMVSMGTNPPHGINININLEILISNVYVSPIAESWYVDVVRSVLEKYGLSKIRVIQSELYLVK